MSDLETVAPDTFSTRQELAAGLTILRLRSGLTIRELARQLELPTATVGDYMAGRRLPGPGQLENFARFLSVCGVSQDGGHRAWLDAVARVRVATDGRLSR
jgi:transcriptional regulator with XRE-family HTH domain